MIEGLHLSHGPVPGDLSSEMLVLLINSDKLNAVPCALPTQLTDVTQSSEPSAYSRAFSVCLFL